MRSALRFHNRVKFQLPDLETLVALHLLCRLGASGGGSAGNHDAAHVAAGFGGSIVDRRSADEIVGSVLLLIVRTADEEAWIGDSARDSLGERNIVRSVGDDELLRVRDQSLGVRETG
jgi:hypothetical protein